MYDQLLGKFQIKNLVSVKNLNISQKVGWGVDVWKPGLLGSIWRHKLKIGVRDEHYHIQFNFLDANLFFIGKVVYGEYEWMRCRM